jgi:hypothetical protein
VTDRICGLLRARYPAKTHALLFEVRNDAGFNANRSCDALAMGLWPSRGLKLTGFEFKVSRADWLKEYRNPEKAESFSVFCDEWYIVAGDKTLVQPDELPEKWGLLVAEGQRLVCVKEAPKLTPEPLDRGLLAAMLKRAQDQFSAPAKTARDEGYAAGRKSAQDSAAEHAGYEKKQLDELRQRVYAFEQASGISLTYSGDGEKIGRAVSLVMNGAHHQLQYPLQELHRNATSLVDAIQRLQTAARAEVNLTEPQPAVPA